MRFFVTVFLSFFVYTVFSQNNDSDFIEKDSLIYIKQQPSKGFYNDYILFIPKETPFNKKVVLLIEPNNTGKTSDSIEVHKKSAIDLATKSSVGNNVATLLKIPLLVPVFPRPAAEPMMYTHALDRDVILDEEATYKRLDLQLLAMIKDAKKLLNNRNIVVDEKVFMSGFSASGTFVNRFSFIHPEIIKALAIGGFNGELMLPLNKINAITLNYPIGISDFEKLFSKPFNFHSYAKLQQFVYMGKLDENDAVQFEDAYSKSDQKLINENIGYNVYPRYLKCQEIYKKQGVNPIFKSYEDVGHWTTSEMNLEIAKFFFKIFRSEIIEK